jgi:hypothetical protein
MAQQRSSLRRLMVAFILVTGGLSVALFAGRQAWPKALAPWRDWLLAQAVPPPNPPTASGPRDGARLPVVQTQSPAERDGGGDRLAAAGFEYPPDESGRLLQEKLTPPRKVQVAAFPFVTKPGQPRPAIAEELGRHGPKLPGAESSGAAAPVLPDERRMLAKAAPALDSPPLPLELVPDLPGRPTWPRPQLAHVPGPDPQQVPPLPQMGMPLTEKPALQDDPTAGAARESLLVPAQVSAPILPPLLRLSIPDPYQYQEVVRFDNPPPDRDPPAQGYQRPAVPALALSPPPKPKGK